MCPGSLWGPTWNIYVLKEHLLPGECALCVRQELCAPSWSQIWKCFARENPAKKAKKRGNFSETFPKVSQWMYGEFAFCLLCCLHVYSPSLSFPLAVFPTKGKKKEKAKRNNLINFVCVGGRHKNCRLDPGTGLKILPNTQTRTHMTGWHTHTRPGYPVKN